MRPDQMRSVRSMSDIVRTEIARQQSKIKELEKELMRRREIVRKLKS